jgi:hypothetical protein
MRNQILFISLFLLYYTNFFSQDLLIKKDSSRLEVKLLEVNPLSIKYKLYSNLNGPDYIIDKMEVAIIRYQNGIQETFNELENLNQIGEQPSLSANKTEGSKKREVKLQDYVNFNLQGGVVINNAYCNKPRNDGFSEKTSSEKYYGYSKKNNINLNIGFNFLLGKSSYVKYIIGVNYLRSQGEFDYVNSSLGTSIIPNTIKSNYSTNLHYTSKVDFLNIVTGIRFTIAKKFHVDPCISLNTILNKDVRVTGSSTLKSFYDVSANMPPIEEITYYNNAKPFDEKIGNTFSFCPKISYEFLIKNQKLGIYYSYNIAYEYRLPWNMIGITYYPFKKLRS